MRFRFECVALFFVVIVAACTVSCVRAPSGRFANGLKLLEQDKDEEALAILEPLSRQDPNSVNVHKALAKVYHRLLQDKKAYLQCKAVLDLQPNDIECLLGSCTLLSMNVPLSLKNFETAQQAVRMAPRNAQTHRFLGEMLYNFRNYARAREEFLAAKRINANLDPFFYFHLGDVEDLCGDPSSARAAYSEALRRHPPPDLRDRITAKLWRLPPR